MQMFIKKFRQWLDYNLGPLVLEVTALPTEPQPLPNVTTTLPRWLPTYATPVKTFSRSWTWSSFTNVRSWLTSPASSSSSPSPSCTPSQQRQSSPAPWSSALTPWTIRSYDIKSTVFYPVYKCTLSLQCNSTKFSLQYFVIIFFEKSALYSRRNIFSILASWPLFAFLSPLMIYLSFLKTRHLTIDKLAKLHGSSFCIHLTSLIFSELGTHHSVVNHNPLFVQICVA